MRRTTFGGRAVAALVGAVITTAPMAACHNVTDSLLQATDPDLINPTDVQSVEGAIALYNGTLSRLSDITGGTSNGTESVWMFGGLLADEWSSSSTFVQNDETDQRSIQQNNSSVRDMFRGEARARTSANQAIAALKQYRPNPQGPIAEMYFVRGYAELQLAENWCNGIPLSDGTGPDPVYGAPKTGADVLNIAIASFDTAMTLSATPAAGDTTAATVNRAARIGRARALMSLGKDRFAEAAALVSAIPTTFAYQMTYATAPSTRSNTLWGQGLSAKRYSVGDSLEGNGRNILVKNVVPFGSLNDPRVPVVDTKKAGQDGQTFTRTTSIWTQTSPVDVVDGLDARLIEAENALNAGNVTQWLSILNALRASPPQISAIKPAAMPALADPGTPDKRIDLMFREKALWTFGRGERLGDLRRLVREYGRAPENVFPVGVHYKGGNYGSDVNLPVPTDEKNNPNENQDPNAPTCIDRKA